MELIIQEELLATKYKEVSIEYHGCRANKTTDDEAELELETRGNYSAAGLRAKEYFAAM